MKLLSRTQSLCPICQKPVEADYISRDSRVYLRKTCELHGVFESYIAESEGDFVKWNSSPVINIPPKQALTGGMNRSEIGDGPESQCPLHCGPCEDHLQTACCVLIDITNRCNQHCPYCFASSEPEDPDEPSLAEMARKLDLLIQLGEKRTFNLQLSGGEPTVRDDLPEIIQMARAKGFPYIQINTNGKRLASEEGYAKALKEAGASAIFLQFDGTRDSIYETLRGEPLLETKKKAVENCRRAGIPVTIVPTVVKNVNLEQIGEIFDFLLENADVVKGMHLQPVSFFGRHPDELPFDGTKYTDFENRVTMFDIMHELEKQSGGRLKYEDFYPITSGHPLCCFSSTYQKKRDGSIKNLISHKTKELGMSCCESKDPLEIIKKDRDFVLSKWNLPEKQSSCGCCSQPTPASTDSCCCSPEPAATVSGCCSPASSSSDSCETMSFDQFLSEVKGGMFSVSCMAFQDATNLDAERLKRCRVHVLSKDDRLIPFCAYNSIYRPEMK